MKRIFFLSLLLLFFSFFSYANMNFSGDLYLGGNGAYTLKKDLDGSNNSEFAGYLNSNLNLLLQSEKFFLSFYGELDRDNFYYEKDGKIALGFMNDTVGNSRFYFQYKDKDDITESDNDNREQIYYLENTKYFSDDFYFSVNGKFDFLKYKEMKNDLYNYNIISLGTIISYSDYSFSYSYEKEEYDDGPTPGYKENSFVVDNSSYMNNFVLNNSLSYTIKKYDFVTEDYNDYNEFVVYLKDGYRILPNFIPYLFSNLTLHNEKDNIGDFTSYEIGMEINMFKYPLVLSGSFERKDYLHEMSSRISYNKYKASLNWSIWSDSFSFYIEDSAELQKLEDIKSTEFPEPKNNNYLNTTSLVLSFDISRRYSVNFNGAYEFKRYFVEDEMNANYNQINISLEFVYNLLFKYKWNTKLEYVGTTYETYDENDTTELTLFSAIQYSF